jgi:hypothetical protein
MVGKYKTKGVVGIFMLLLLSACAQPKTLYHYGDYSDCYYQDKKKGTPETHQELITAIEKAISEASNSKSGRVPPGMYANLGYIYLKDGNAKKAISLFEKERETYPESAHFMERVIAKVKTTETKETQQ